MRLLSEPSAEALNETNQMEAHEETDGLLSELFESLNNLGFSDGATEEDQRRQLYAAVASVFA